MYKYVWAISYNHAIFLMPDRNYVNKGPIQTCTTKCCLINWLFKNCKFETGLPELLENKQELGYTNLWLHHKCVILTLWKVGVRESFNTLPVYHPSMHYSSNNALILFIQLESNTLDKKVANHWNRIKIMGSMATKISWINSEILTFDSSQGGEP